MIIISVYLLLNMEDLLQSEIPRKRFLLYIYFFCVNNFVLSTFVGRNLL